MMRWPAANAMLFTHRRFAWPYDRDRADGSGATRPAPNNFARTPTGERLLFTPRSGGAPQACSNSP